MPCPRNPADCLKISETQVKLHLTGALCSRGCNRNCYITQNIEATGKFVFQIWNRLAFKGMEISKLDGKNDEARVHTGMVELWSERNVCC
jgi:hypothetical protein